MASTSLPLVGIIVLLGIVGCWRPSLQSRRYGSSGVLFFRSGNSRQKVRDALGVLLVACLIGQGITAVRWPQALSPLYDPEPSVWYGIGTVWLNFISARR